MTETGVPTTPATRWPDVERVPRAPLRAVTARALLKFVAGRIPVRVVTGDEPQPPGPPVLRLRRPDAFYRRIGTTGLIGLGEAYQAGDWYADDLAGLLTAAAAGMNGSLGGYRKLAKLRHVPWLKPLHGARSPASEENTVEGARRNIQRHYDLSNEMFALFLDETMTYSSGLFAGPEDEDLAAAQRRKIDRLLDLTGVGDGTRVLEIGTGWGELAIRAARRGARVHTVTISTEQQQLAQQRVTDAGVADRVTIELCDYRHVIGEREYDAIISVEMIEAVGRKYWPDYFGAIDRLLAPGGRAGLQAITLPDHRIEFAETYTWVQKYIFPGGVMLSTEEVARQLAAGTSLRSVEKRAFGWSYAKTLRAWRERFLSNADQVRSLGFDDIFVRTWEYYLAYCEAGFVSGEIDVCQLILDRE
ncbi:cyclopropane-fatty-acyl-phospholipid synthase family protein [Actinoplanes sp. KI2]|uniref:SAM-dependent methyltransferase n=1 Tax=Actinoplanes sp. KI2 TaxID=2983315 RepID=UPI0021D5B524|nr:cyclopropane-fatty-acyl-phospholipid synthase family protein [Actinoplanes sp. KI2]MCU7726810.1 cyclopropane-fatty-acyl-phospholipid synthase family protein [Actinoplanes sp. KI2]